MNAHALRTLADAGVPANVRDAMAEVSGAVPAGNWRYGRYGRGENAGWPRYDPWAYGYYRPFRYDGYAAYLYGYATYTVELATFGYGYPSFGYGFPRTFVSVRPSVVGYIYPPVLVLHANPLGTDDAANGMAGKAETADPQRPGTASPGTAGAAVGKAVAAAAAGIASAVGEASKSAPTSGGKTAPARQ